MKYLLVETDKIISNIELIRQTAGDSQLIAVLKANAYGLGLREIYPVLRQCGVRKAGGDRAGGRPDPARAGRRG